MKALQIATIFALLVLGAMSNNVQPTETLAQRIPSHGLKMLGSCFSCSKPIKNDTPKRFEPSHPVNVQSALSGSSKHIIGYDSQMNPSLMQRRPSNARSQDYKPLRQKHNGDIHDIPPKKKMLGQEMSQPSSGLKVLATNASNYQRSSMYRPYIDIPRPAI
jgi:hypothetical protein